MVCSKGFGFLLNALAVAIPGADMVTIRCREKLASRKDSEADEKVLFDKAYFQQQKPLQSQQLFIN